MWQPRRRCSKEFAIKQLTERKAGEGNRTLVCSLGSCRSTIELHPQRNFRFSIADVRFASREITATKSRRLPPSHRCPEFAPCPKTTRLLQFQADLAQRLRLHRTDWLCCYRRCHRSRFCKVFPRDRNIDRL